MAIPRVSGADWEVAVLGASGPVLVEFWSLTCPVCARMQPVVERVAAELEGRAPVYQVVVEEEEDLVWAYGVMSTPTFLVMSDGEPAHTLHGDVEGPLLVGLVEGLM